MPEMQEQFSGECVSRQHPPKQKTKPRGSKQEHALLAASLAAQCNDRIDQGGSSRGNGACDARDDRKADRDKHVGSSVTRRDAEDQAFERRTRCERGEQSDRDAEPGEAEPFTQELADQARTKSHADQAANFWRCPA